MKMDDYFTNECLLEAHEERERTRKYALFLSQPGSSSMPLPEEFWPQGILYQRNDRAKDYHELRRRLDKKNLLAGYKL
jgi:hypothetical protein